MKRILLSLFILSFCLTMTAHDAVHLQRLVQCVNDSDFNCALEELPLVEDWSKDMSQDSIWLDVQSATDFVAYLDSVDWDLGQRDSVKMHIVKVFKDYYHYYEARKQGAYAIDGLKLIAAITKSVNGETDSVYSAALNNIAIAYANAGDYKNAEIYFLQVLQNHMQNLGEKDSKTARVLNNLGVVYEKIGDYGKAESYYNQALERYKEVFGETSLDYAHVKYYAGKFYKEQGQYAKAEQYILGTIEIYEKNGETNALEYVYSLNDLGAVYSFIGNFEQSIDYYKKALNGIELILGKQDYKYAVVLFNIGYIYVDMGDFPTAEKYCLDALEILKGTIGESHPTYAECLSSIGSLYFEKRDYENAIKYLQQALEIKKILYGENHIRYMRSLNELANIYAESGQYEKAEDILSKLEARQKETIGENTYDYTITINNLGILYYHMGAFRKAEKAFLKTLQIRKELFNEENELFLQPINNLAGCYESLKEYDQAEKYFLEVLRIRKALQGDSLPEYARNLCNLGILYFNMGEYLKADSCIEGSLSIFEKTLGENHPDYAKVLNMLGLCSKHANNIQKAEQSYLKAIKIFQETTGISDPSYRLPLQNIGQLYVEEGEYSKAEQYYRELDKLNRTSYLLSMDFMTEEQRSSYWDKMRKIYEMNYTQLAYDYYPFNHNIASFAYDNELLVKGLLLTSSNTIRQSILESGDTTLINQWNTLTDIKQEMISLSTQDPQSEELAQYEQQAEVLEKAITKSSAAYRENQRQWTITWDSVRNVLKPNQVAIEYMVVPLNDDSTIYCALLLRDTCTYPILIPLFEEKEVTDLLNNSTASSINETYAYAGNGKQLSRLIWGKVLRYIQPGEVVFFAPTGLLHQVAMESLPNDASGTINDVYNLVRLSSTRELVLNKPAIPHQDAALYGGIFYEPLDSVKLRRISEKYRPAKRSTPSLANDTTQRSMAEYLPGTKEEIEAIRPILEHQKISVQMHSKNDACEESFKALSGQKQNVLHLATHGFYWTDTTWSPDPMDRCGLLFAGANTALSGHSERLPEGADDGILTAKEISVLDFRGADIVVMSACETGLGDISGEGVFGLQRAFKMAGAQSLLMAIWSVNDRATQMLMTAFHRYMGAGYTKRQAFRLAQQEVRNYEEIEERSSKSHASSKDKYKNKGKNVTPQDEDTETVIETIVTHPYQSPYYWAGFILLD